MTSIIQTSNNCSNTHRDSSIKIRSYLRVMNRERVATLYYRKRMRLSISHIAKILGRSTRTIHKIIKGISSASKKYHPSFDKRKLPKLMKTRGESWFRAKKVLLQWCAYVFLIGISDSIEVLLGEKPP